MEAAIIVTAFTVAIAMYRFWPTIASAAMTEDEINACATIVALKDYRREYDWGTKQWTPDARTEEDAMQSLIVDSGERPNFIAIAHSYDRFANMGIPTVYHRYVNEGIALCAAMKLRGEKIEFLSLKVRAGYHVTRSNGSAILVKDGDPEPVFGCMQGYRPTGTGCIPN